MVASNFVKTTFMERKKIPSTYNIQIFKIALELEQILPASNNFKFLNYLNQILAQIPVPKLRISAPNSINSKKQTNPQFPTHIYILQDEEEGEEKSIPRREMYVRNDKPLKLGKHNY